VRGRIVREQENGFVLATDAGEVLFIPARIAAGKIEADLTVRDVAAPFLGDLGYCRKFPVGTYSCVALHEGAESAIQQVPIGRGR
jgi:hypothetical protein